MRQILLSFWDSVLDGVSDIAAHKSRSVLQLVGIVLGVGSVVATLGMIDGGRRQMNAFFEQTGGVRKMLVRDKELEDAQQTATERRARGLSYDDAQALAAEAKTLELVEPTMVREEIVRGQGFEKTLEISGATWAYEPMYDFHAAEGRFLTPQDLATSAKVVVLGATRRDQIFGGGPAVGRTLSIGGSAYTVVGVMQRKEFYWNSANSNSLEWMNEFVFVPVTSMLNRMAGDRDGQKVAYVNVQVRDVGQMDAAMEEVTSILRRRHDGVVNFDVVNRAARMRQMEQQGRIYDVTFMVCGTISLLVGGIVIMNILLASFNERVREVGTRKALGATPLNILAQFLVESVVVTLLGGLIGLGLGAGFAKLMSDLLQQPVVLTPPMLLTGLLFAGTVGILFGFYPAVKAARLNPIEALRYE